MQLGHVDIGPTKHTVSDKTASQPTCPTSSIWEEKRMMASIDHAIGRHYIKYSVPCAKFEKMEATTQGITAIRQESLDNATVVEAKRYKKAQQTGASSNNTIIKLAKRKTKLGEANRFVTAKTEYLR